MTEIHSEPNKDTPQKKDEEISQGWGRFTGPVVVDLDFSREDDDHDYETDSHTPRHRNGGGSTWTGESLEDYPPADNDDAWLGFAGYRTVLTQNPQKPFPRLQAKRLKL